MPVDIAPHFTSAALEAQASRYGAPVAESIRSHAPERQPDVAAGLSPATSRSRPARRLRSRPGVGADGPAWVERVYSRGWYPALQPMVTSLSSLAPVALLDVWIVLACSRPHGPAGGSPRAVGHAARRIAGALTRGIVAAGAVVYIVFLGLWGLNYRRLPITERLDFDRSRVTAAEVDAASRRAVAELNRLYQPAHADPEATPTLAAMRVRLAPAFTLAQRAWAPTRRRRPGARRPR